MAFSHAILPISWFVGQPRWSQDRSVERALTDNVLHLSRVGNRRDLDLGATNDPQQQLREHRVRSKCRDTSVEKSPLTGRLVDENGDGLTPSHARKGERPQIVVKMK